MLGDLLLEDSELPSRLRELLLQPRELSAIPMLPPSHLVSLPPNGRQVQPETDSVLSHAIEIRLEACDPSEDVAALILKKPLFRLARLQGIPQGLDLGYLPAELRLHLRVTSLGGGELGVEEGDSLREEEGAHQYV